MKNFLKFCQQIVFSDYYRSSFSSCRLLFQVVKGKAEVTVKIADLQSKLKNLTLEDLAETQSKFYIAVTVTDILSKAINNKLLCLLCYFNVK